MVRTKAMSEVLIFLREEGKYWKKIDWVKKSDIKGFKGMLFIEWSENESDMPPSRIHGIRSVWEKSVIWERCGSN